MAARSDGASRNKSGRKTAPVLDLEALRAGLAANKLVRVSIVPSGSFPDGATGRVRAIGDPETDGDEFLQVEIGTGRSRDVLPFAPADLAPYRRGGPASAVGSSTPTTEQSRRSAPHTGRRSADRSPRPAVRSARSPAEPAPTSEPAPTPRSTGTADADPGELFPPPEPVTSAGPRVPGPLAREDPPVKRGSGRTRGKRPAVTITVSTDGESGWRVEARVGSRVVVRAAPVSPAGVAEIARDLGEPRLVEVVDGLLAEHRRAVQTRADHLAAELAEVQAELELFPTS